MQRELLTLAVDHNGVPSFQDACALFYEKHSPKVDLEKEFARCPISDLERFAFRGHPDAKHMLSIRAAVCRSLARLEERDLIQRGHGLFPATIDGYMDVAVSRLSVNTDALTVKEAA